MNFGGNYHCFRHEVTTEPYKSSQERIQCLSPQGYKPNVWGLKSIRMWNNNNKINDNTFTRNAKIQYTRFDQVDLP